MAHIRYRMPPALVDLLKDFVEQYLPDIEVSLPESNSRKSHSPAHLKWIQETSCINTNML